MADDQQQPGQPPAGVPGSWPPPAPNQDLGAPQPGTPPPPAGAPAGWAPQQPPTWSPEQPPQQPPAWGQQPPPTQGPPAWGQQPTQPQQPPAWQPPQQPWAQQPPAPGGYPPPPYGGPGYPPPAYDYGPRYAGFWIRFVAWIVDFLIWGFAITAALISILVIVGFVLLPLVFFGYFPFLWWRRGATFGQSLMGLRVVRAIDGGPIDGGMVFIRTLVFYAEMFFGFWLIGLLGCVWAAFEPRKRAWHDMAAGTVVIHVN